MAQQIKNYKQTIINLFCKPTMFHFKTLESNIYIIKEALAEHEYVILHIDVNL